MESFRVARFEGGPLDGLEEPVRPATYTICRAGAVYRLQREEVFWNESCYQSTRIFVADNQPHLDQI